MQVVCEATQCNNVPVQVAALQNLVKIMSLYYQYMESYMGPALFAVSDTLLRGLIPVHCSKVGSVCPLMPMLVVLDMIRLYMCIKIHVYWS